IPKEDIIILFSRHEETVVEEIKKLGVSVYTYQDERYDFEYIPSLKPYLMYRYLEEDISRENETYFFMDSDAIIREQPSINSEEYTRYDQRRSEEHTSELQSRFDLVCRLLLEKKK